MVALNQTKSALTNSEKAAILFLLLGEENSVLVFKSLNVREISHITEYITNMSAPNKSDIEAVIKETIQRASSNSLLPTATVDYITNVLIRSIGEKKASGILQRLNAPVSIVAESSMSAIKDLDSEMLFNIIHMEHPQIIALVLSHTPPEKAAEVLAKVSEDKRKEVALRICRLDRISPKVIAEINQSLAGRLRAYKESERKVVGGVDQVAQILNNIDHASEETIIEFIEESNPEIAENIKLLMFTFEDLSTATDKDIQVILKDVPKDVLCLAMKTATEDMRRIILRNMSERASQMLMEDIENMGAVKLNLVEKAQQEIIQIAKRLEEEGIITIKTKGADDVLV